MQFDGWENQRALSEARRYGGYDTLEDGSDKRDFILSFSATRQSVDLRATGHAAPPVP